MNTRDPTIDCEIFDLIARLRQIQAETDLLAAQQKSLEHQLSEAEAVRDRQLIAVGGSTTGVGGEGFRLALAPVADPVLDTVDEASEESFPCSDSPAWSRKDCS